MFSDLHGVVPHFKWLKFEHPIPSSQENSAFIYPEINRQYPHGIRYALPNARAIESARCHRKRLPDSPVSPFRPAWTLPSRYGMQQR
ncbi:hypothetical protein [Burkholderia lata]|uniref:hypothetical protein n=1 Tax=Burkholderia lata (strain ATCC 17760 / DSM 23089 / LMG 22485 / NCIMB 9086 / R18194 / 383) TaxID=482957 RepID=UPI0015826986|nr:hypothetical protein [Burkholderia lata]